MYRVTLYTHLSRHLCYRDRSIVPCRSGSQNGLSIHINDTSAPTVECQMRLENLLPDTGWLIFFFKLFPPSLFIPLQVLLQCGILRRFCMEDLLRQEPPLDMSLYRLTPPKRSKGNSLGKTSSHFEHTSVVWMLSWLNLLRCL